jgi:FkbM family methyltransferase
LKSRARTARARLVAAIPPEVAAQARRGWAEIIRIQLKRRGYLTNDIGTRLYVDPGDGRAVWLARAAGATNRHLLLLWKQLLDQLQPQLVIDVGANYGEVAFSTRYPRTTTVHLVEANPALWGLLERTIVKAQVSNFVLHPYAASDAAGEVVLHIREESSGLSSISETVSSDREVAVQSRRLDDLILAKAATRILFKIDVEGHEVAVLRGMSRLLENHDYAGIVEVWPGSEAELAERHAIYLVDRHPMLLHRVDVDELVHHVRLAASRCDQPSDHNLPRQRLLDVVVMPLESTPATGLVPTEPN